VVKDPANQPNRFLRLYSPSGYEYIPDEVELLDGTVLDTVSSLVVGKTGVLRGIFGVP